MVGWGGVVAWLGGEGKEYQIGQVTLRGGVGAFNCCPVTLFGGGGGQLEVL